MAVAADMKALVLEAVIARIKGVGRDDAFGHVGQGLGGLECGARRILPHYRTVEQRTPGVARQKGVILSALATYHAPGVVSRGGHHAQHLARRRFDGHDGPYLAFEKTLAESLKLDVEREGEVFAGHGLVVVETVLVFSLNASAGIAQKNLDTLLAAKLLLVVALHAKFPDVVACLVIVVILDVVLRHLGNISKNMGGIRILILSDGAFLDVKAGETEEFLLKHGELLL